MSGAMVYKQLEPPKKQTKIANSDWEKNMRMGIENPKKWWQNGGITLGSCSHCGFVNHPGLLGRLYIPLLHQASRPEMAPMYLGWTWKFN